MNTILKPFAMVCAIVCVVCAMLIALPATAQQQKQHFGITPGFGTLGFMVEGHYVINDSYGIRIPLGFGRYRSTNLGAFGLRGQSESLDSSGSVRTGGVGILADWYPRLGRFRVSVGALFSLYEIRADFTGAADIPINVGSTDYFNTSVQTTAKFKNGIAPMISIGYGGNLTRRASFNFEVGAILSSGYNVTLTQTSGAPIPQADLDAELGELSDQLNKNQMFPYIKFGVTFAF